MLQFYRKPALSEIKTGLKLTEIKQIVPRAVGLKTELIFYVDIKEPLTEEESRELDWYLAETYEPDQFGIRSFLEANGKVVEVGPRLSLVTPWSTSAGAIFEASNLPKVNRIEVAWRYCLVLEGGTTLGDNQIQQITELLHDKMIEQIYQSSLLTFDSGIIPEPVQTIPILEKGKPALRKFAEDYGLGFTPEMEEYICAHFNNELKRDPTDVELFMFGQLNSEHCRHHIFNGKWEIDGIVKQQPLMGMIRETVGVNPGNIAVAFKDNAAVLNPREVKALIPLRPDVVSSFTVVTVRRGIVLKIETHNHPTAIAPYPGAATGVAVRRDVFGTGQGGVPIGHLACYYVGNLFIPGYVMPWEKEYIGYSSRFATPLKIKIEASNGASDNCNCFGNPVVVGATRSFEQIIDGTHYGYRKTAMVAGSFGYIDERHIKKGKPEKGMLIVQTGGYSFPIGVGGGSGSSKDAGGQDLKLDFNSVQRDDAFTERGNFNVIRACSELGNDNPIVTLTDLGAGGDCVALPELVFPIGAKIEVRKIPCGDKTMTVCVYFCNEAQERMVFLIRKEKLVVFQSICERNRCRMAVIGKVTGDGQFVLTDSQAGPDAPREQKTPIDLNMNWLLANLPQRLIVCQTAKRRLEPPRIPDVSVREHLNLVFSLLDVGSKEYLTRKADRTVGNRSVRQQEVGPMQLPLANCAVMSDGPFGKTGQIIAIGEQPIKGLVNNGAGIRMSIGEAFTNAVWAPVRNLSDFNFSATWQWPCGQPGEDARLYRAVEAARACCIKLLSRIGVGKDSLSMTLKEMESDGTVHPILSPGTVQMVAFGPCDDINKVVTPDIKIPGKTKLMFVDLAKGAQRLGGSALLRVYEQIGDEPPDLEDAEFFVRALMAVQKLIRRGLILSGHDRSDGALIGCLSEMAFAGNCGLRLNLLGSRLGGNDRDKLLFNEELGLVFEFLPKKYDSIRGILSRCGISEHCHVIGDTINDDVIEVRYNGKVVLQESMSYLRGIWRETSFRLDELQATSPTVKEERENTYKRSGPKYSLSFTPKPTPRSAIIKKTKPKVAVLWEAGTNGDRDMAESCYLAGLDPWDVCMKDLIAGNATLKDYMAMLLPGGFAFRDTLDAGKGLAGVFKFNERATDELAAFVERQDTLILGSCNGCQEMTLLSILPWPGISTEKLPRFIRNTSERFEHRQVTVRIMTDSNSVFLKGMEGSVLGAIISHGQGRFHCPDQEVLNQIIQKGLAPIRYVDDQGEVTEKRPFNPNGSPLGIAGISSQNGRFLALMPHPERLPLNNLWPWQPREWKNLKASPWIRVFQNVRKFCE